MIRILFITFFLLACTAGPVGAVSDTFTVSTLIGADTTPPTTPTLISAIPVSSSQIDLSWSASSDDFLLGGYQVFRGSVQIATTTLTSFNDTGLSPSTLYTYTIRAFDSVFNYSTTSNALATTTQALGTPTTTPSTGGSTSGSKGSSIQEFSVFPETHSARFEWNTSSYMRFVLRWGRTSSYELGSVSSDVLRKRHTTTLTDLDAGTSYQYELVGYTESGKKTVLKSGAFTTQKTADLTPPQNVSNLTAYAVGERVYLSWRNPTDADLGGVRVMRSHLFFPQNRFDGFLVTDGRIESATDKGALLRGQIAYYTVFTYDHSGNVSSGAIIAVEKAGTRTEYTDKKNNDDIATSSLYAITFEDIEFVQNDELIEKDRLMVGVPLRIRIAYEKLPEHLKTITVTFAREGGTTHSYLLKINPQKTYYEAYLRGYEISGSVDARLDVYDFQIQHMRSVQGVLTFIPAKKNVSTVLEPLITTLAVPSEVATFVFFVFTFFSITFVCIWFRRIHSWSDS
jgi:hypothetical protein